MKIHTRTFMPLVALLWAVGCSGAAAPDAPESTELDAAEAAPPSGQAVTAEEGPGAALPSATPTQEIGASEESTAETGVSTWKLYDGLESGSIHVYGVDGEGRVVSALRIGGTLGAEGAVASTQMESLYPLAGRLEVDADGQVVVDQLPAEAAVAFGAMGRDFQATIDTAGPELQASRFACIRAGVLVGGTCGLAVIGCVTSAPTIALGLLICGGGAIGCGAAMQDWACACHDVCVN